MKSGIWKRGILLLLCGVIFFGATACQKRESAPENGQTAQAGEGTVFAEPVDISIAVCSHPSWPYNENWVFWKYFKEALGANVKVQAIPNADLNTKLALMMASPDTLPDLFHMSSKKLADQYAQSGALVAIDDYLDQMPNYTKFWNSLPEDERDELLMLRRSSDGKTYYPQVHGMERSMNVKGWLYRKDIFEKHGLSTPETMEELYQVALQLKKLYPESYPICMRNGLINIATIGPEWKPYFTHGTYYDFVNEKWSFGATEETMLDIVKYFKKLYDAQLLPPDYLTITTKAWEELMMTDKGFITPEYQVRIDYFNTPARKESPDYTLSMMKPPRADTATGQNKIAKFNVDPTGYMICNTGKEDRIANAIRVLDWMYSDEACALLSWGKEGETYEVVDGKKQFIVKQDGNPKQDYGVETNGLYCRIDPESADALVSKEQAATTDFALEYTEDQYNPLNWLAFNEEEMQVKIQYENDIHNYTEEMLSKFLMGIKPLSEWDAFQNSLQEMGVPELLAIYSSAYERVKNSK